MRLRYVGPERNCVHNGKTLEPGEVIEVSDRDGESILARGAKVFERLGKPAHPPHPPKEKEKDK